MSSHRVGGRNDERNWYWELGAVLNGLADFERETSNRNAIVVFLALSNQIILRHGRAAGLFLFWLPY
jgi:hypothetical protein